MDNKSKKNLINDCFALVEYQTQEKELKAANEPSHSPLCTIVSFRNRKTPKVT